MGGRTESGIATVKSFQNTVSRRILRYRVQNLEFQSLVFFITVNNSSNELAKKLLADTARSNVVTDILGFTDKTVCAIEVAVQQKHLSA